MLPSLGRLGRARPEEARPAPSEPPIPLVRRSLPPEPPTALKEPVLELETVLGEMDEATSPGDVTRLLVLGLQTVAHRVAVFSVRGRVLRGRAGSSSLGGNEALGRMDLDLASGGVLAHAVEAGHYLGPADAELGALVAQDADEIYIGRIDVSGRPALVFVLASMTNAFLASQRADRLSRAARKALERIVVTKKTRG